MMDMSDEKRCLQCGAVVAANAPRGLCPKCLVRMAVGETRIPSSPAPAVPLTEQPGDRIGHHILREKIGEGGCGIVYVAEQQEPVRRKVALKIIKLGMDTREVIARFEAEAEFYSRRAVEVSPNDPECGRVRAKVLEQRGKVKPVSN